MGPCQVGNQGIKDQEGFIVFMAKLTIQKHKPLNLEDSIISNLCISLCLLERAKKLTLLHKIDISPCPAPPKWYIDFGSCQMAKTYTPHLNVSL